MDFNRHVCNELIDALKRQDLCEKKLKADCEKGEVFLAVRRDRVCFYRKGGRLFEFDGKSFKTHVKYTLVVDTEKENAQNDYVCEDQLGKIPLIPNFLDGYDGIKKNCELYSRIEAKGVSRLYQESSYLKQDSIFVLDVEIVLKDGDGEKDRIDILLYNNDQQTLRFVEAKLFGNSDSLHSATPGVIGQIRGYEEQIASHEEKIIEEYGRYIGNLNNIFGTGFKHPARVDPKVSLLVFDYNRADETSERFKKMRHTVREEGILSYCRGHSDGLNATSVWNGN